MSARCKMERRFLSGTLMGQLVAAVGGKFLDEGTLNSSAMHISCLPLPIQLSSQIREHFGGN